MKKRGIKKAVKKASKHSCAKSSSIVKSSRKVKRYVCPNCGEDKPTMRGKCPYCNTMG